MVTESSCWAASAAPGARQRRNATMDRRMGAAINLPPYDGAAIPLQPTPAIQTMRILTALSLLALSQAPDVLARAKPLRIFISVDMEGIGGMGTPAMQSPYWKVYNNGRERMVAGAKRT